MQVVGRIIGQFKLLVLPQRAARLLRAPADQLPDGVETHIDGVGRQAQSAHNVGAQSQRVRRVRVAVQRVAPIIVQRRLPQPGQAVVTVHNVRAIRQRNPRDQRRRAAEIVAVTEIPRRGQDGLQPPAVVITVRLHPVAARFHIGQTNPQALGIAIEIGGPGVPLARELAGRRPCKPVIARRIHHVRQPVQAIIRAEDGGLRVENGGQISNAIVGVRRVALFRRPAIWGNGHRFGAAAEEQRHKDSDENELPTSHADGQRKCPPKGLPSQSNFASIPLDIAGAVASLTKSDLSSVALAKEELGAVGETTYTTPLVDRDQPSQNRYGATSSSTRWASCLAVEFE